MLKFDDMQRRYLTIENTRVSPPYIGHEEQNC